MNYTIEELKHWLKSNLDAERYIHTLGVAECAEILAEKYGLDKEKAYIAGLLHDCAKCISKNDLLEMIKHYPDLCKDELTNPKTYHAPAGAIIAQKEFGIEDEEILSAIRWHTLGKVCMTFFEKIIFLADKIEDKTRPVEWTKPIKDVLDTEKGLDKGLLICYKSTIKSLVDRNIKICPTTIDIYNKLLDEISLY